MRMQTKPKPSSCPAIEIFCYPARLWRALCLLGSFALVASLATGCATRQLSPETQDVLLGSGFKLVTPSTPDQLALLRKLPPGKFTVVNRKGKTWYVFPDTAHDRAYVGNPSQYASFRQSYQDEQLTSGETGEVNLAKDSAEWDAWDALGVWGGPY
jgi:hypothetical protein